MAKIKDAKIKEVKMTASGRHARHRGQGWARSGKERSSEYRSYCHAEQRCINPKDAAYRNYGGRGIRFLFTSFEQFIAEIGPRPAGKTLDRKDNNGNYEPGNVRWATWSEQMKNRRIIVPTAQHRANNSAALKACWVRPAYKKRMIEAQRARRLREKGINCLR
jgi:hypothetical protein